MAFFVFLLVEFIEDVAAATAEPTAIATPTPLMMFAVFFHNFSPQFIILHFFVQYYCLRRMKFLKVKINAIQYYFSKRMFLKNIFKYFNEQQNFINGNFFIKKQCKNISVSALPFY